MRLVKSIVGAASAPTSTCQPLKHHYRPEIDGLRAIAVLAVVLYHAGELVPGGYVGVDIFFVISGYLITKVIQSQIDEGAFSMINFWERRIRRLMPALIVMVAVTLLAGCLVLSPSDLTRLSSSSLAQLALLANVHFWLASGYFELAAETKPLLHTWSLAVEEQFYLLLPPALIALSRLRRRQVPALLAICTLLSFGVSVHGADQFPSATFYLLPTRAWELLVGSLLAYVGGRPRANTRGLSAIGTFGLLCMLLPMALYERSTVFPGLAAAPPVLGTAAVLYATSRQPRSSLTRALSWRALTSIGLISYSLYLWHWPALVLLDLRFPDHGTLAVALAVLSSLTLGVFSWKFVETPVRRRRVLHSRRSLLASSMATVGFLVACSIFIMRSDGLPSRFHFDIVSLEADLEYTGDEYDTPRSPSSPLTTSLGVQLERNLDFILWGDSHARCIAHVFDEIALEHNLCGESIAISGAPPTLGAVRDSHGSEFRKRLEQVHGHLINERPPRLILVARWDQYIGDQSDFWLRLKTTDVASSATSLDAMRAGLNALQETCRSTDTRIIIFEQVPTIQFNDPARMALNISLGRQKAGKNQAVPTSAIDKERKAFRGILDSLDPSVVEVVDPVTSLSTDKANLRPFLAGRSLYRDSNHLSRTGSQLLQPAIRAALGVH